ncbi:MAG: helix-hairpin-helix domain-containing protein [Bacteroidota bacterium]|nr:helix-hairpin-helix domain-containing protein [Bacteroidota bacterium]
MKIIFSIGACYILCCSCYGQIDASARANYDDVLESVFDNTSEEANQQLFVDDLEYFRMHPVNLRNATYGELTKVPFISPLLAEKILMFRDTVRMVSVNQLLLIPEINWVLLAKITPFIILRDDESGSSWYSITLAELRTRTEKRLQIQQGFQKNKFLGDRNALYQRLKIGNENIECAAVLEKDVGERMNDGFIAGYLNVQNIGALQQFVVGNYSLTAGQGLSLARNMGTSKGSVMAGQIKKKREGISPSASTDEYRYFQGVAGVLHFENVKLIPFYSNRMQTATLDSLNVISSFYPSGIFRTTSDISKRNNVRERIYGGTLTVEISPRIEIGTTALLIAYDKKLIPTLYNFENKKSISTASLFADVVLEEIDMFGEIATNNGNSFSGIFGGIFSIGRRTSFTYHHRSFVPGYVNPLARPFGERDNISDGEIGNYFGMTFTPMDGIVFSGYADSFALPEQSDFGSTGKEYFVQIESKLAKSFEITAHLRTRSASRINIRTEDDERQQVNYRIGYKYTVYSNFIIAQRLEIVNVNYFPTHYFEKGMLTFVELAFNRKSFPVSVKSRFILFDSDSYDARLYQYESNMRGGFSNPPLYGKGMRWYMIATYSMFENLFLSLRYSETKKLDVTVIGSGDDEIAGSLDNQVSLQLDFEL